VRDYIGVGDALDIQFYKPSEVGKTALTMRGWGDASLRMEAICVSAPEAYNRRGPSLGPEPLVTRARFSRLQNFTFIV